MLAGAVSAWNAKPEGGGYNEKGGYLAEAAAENDEPTSQCGNKPAANPSFDPFLKVVHGLRELIDKQTNMERLICSQLQNVEEQLQIVLGNSSTSRKLASRDTFDGHERDVDVPNKACDVQPRGTLFEVAERMKSGTPAEQASESVTRRNPNNAVPSESILGAAVVSRWDSWREDITPVQTQRSMLSDAVLEGRMAFALDAAPVLVILINAVIIGVSADLVPDSDIWLASECVFAAFFLGEILVKLRFVGIRMFFVGRSCYWNYFDCFCVCTAMLDLTLTFHGKLNGPDGADLSGLTMMKMLRLAKLLRLARLLRYKAFSELRLIISGLFNGLRVLVWAQVLLALVICLGGIVMRNLVGETESEFKTVPASMFTIFRCFTDGCAAYDGTPLQERLRMKYGAPVFFGWMLSYVLVTIGLFNLIMAIFVQHVLDAQSERRMLDLGKSADRVRATMEETMLDLYMLHQEGLLGEDDSGILKDELRTSWNSSLGTPVTRDVFNKWLSHPRMMRMLRNADIDIASKFELFDVLDADLSGSLTMNELVRGLMHLRGPISKAEIVSIRLKMRLNTQRLEVMMGAVSEMLQPRTR